jgi:hypothetical protein
MTSFDNYNVECGNCGASSAQMVLESTNAFGSPDLDLRPPEMQRSTMDTWLQLCPVCGYCAPDLSQTPADRAVLHSDVYRAALQSADFPELARRFLAFAVAAGSSDPATAAHAYLHAAWVFDDAGHPEQAAESRRQSATWFRRCTPFPEEERGAAMGAVLVDVLRRCGQFAEASAECQTVLASPAAVGTIRKVLEFQHRLILGADTRAHELSQCE